MKPERYATAADFLETHKRLRPFSYMEVVYSVRKAKQNTDRELKYLKNQGLVIEHHVKIPSTTRQVKYYQWVPEAQKINSKGITIR